MKIQNRHRIGGVVRAGASTFAGAGVAGATTANIDGHYFHNGVRHGSTDVG